MSIRLFVLRILLSGCFAVLAAPPGWGQVRNVTDDQATPTPGAGHDYIRMLTETVNPANGALSVRVQVPMPKGRGLAVPFAFAYDSNGVHYPVSGTGGTVAWSNNGGWSYSVPQLTMVYGQRKSGNYTCAYYTDYVFQDASGSRHALGLATAENGTTGCQNVPSPPASVTSGGDDFVRASTTAPCSGCTLSSPPRQRLPTPAAPSIVSPALARPSIRHPSKTATATRCRSASRGQTSR